MLNRPFAFVRRCRHHGALRATERVALIADKQASGNVKLCATARTTNGSFLVRTAAFDILLDERVRPKPTFAFIYKILTGMAGTILKGY